MLTRKLLLPFAILLGCQVVLAAVTFGVGDAMFDPPWIMSTLVEESYLQSQPPHILMTLAEDIRFGLRNVGAATQGIAFGAALAWILYCAWFSPRMPGQARRGMFVWIFLLVGGLSLAAAFVGRAFVIESFFGNMREDRLPFVGVSLLCLYVLSFYVFGTLVATRRTIRTAVPAASLIFTR